MGIQSLRKGAITSPQELFGFNLSTQTKRRSNYSFLNQANSVLIHTVDECIFLSGFLVRYLQVGKIIFCIA